MGVYVAGRADLPKAPVLRHHHREHRYRKIFGHFPSPAQAQLDFTPAPTKISTSTFRYGLFNISLYHLQLQLIDLP